jgi:amino acid permease
MFYDFALAILLFLVSFLGYQLFNKNQELNRLNQLYRTLYTECQLLRKKLRDRGQPEIQDVTEGQDDA